MRCPSQTHASQQGWSVHASIETRQGFATAGSSDATCRVTGAQQEVTRAEFLTQWRANGHQSVAALAGELGVNVRTAQRWVKANEAVQAENKSVEDE